MRIIACIKAAPDDADIVVDSTRHLDESKAVWKIGSYDLNALEAARQLADETNGEVMGLSLGDQHLDNTKLRKDVLSRGLDSLAILQGDAHADSYQTASALADAIQQDGDTDLVLLGAGSSDRYAQQVGNHLGALLDWPTLNAVEKIEPQGDTLRVERSLEDATQVVQVTLPAVISVTSSINVARIPGMRDILAAGKKPVSGHPAALPPATISLVDVLAPEQVERGHNIIETDPNEAAAQLAEFIKSL